MDEAPLRAWESFYVIVGTTAGALTGLQFVVLTLVAEAGRIRGSGETLAAFGSPNVVHFCAALLVSAMFSAPWHGLGPPGVAVAAAGLGGFVYSVAVLRRASRQRDYKPVLEDWVWHAALPMLAYAALVYAGIQLSRVSAAALFVVAGSTLLLVFIGIHNAWDTVTYVMLERARERKARPAATPTAEPLMAPPSPEVRMSGPHDQHLLEALLDSWDRNNTILVNLLRALPEGGLEARVTASSPSVAQLFTHVHYVRLVFVSEDAPEFATDVPEEYVDERDSALLARRLNESAKTVREAVKSRVLAGRDMNLHYDHPILFLQHMIWHEGYHHGQIKLALKATGRALADQEAGRVTWGIWMRKTRGVG